MSLPYTFTAGTLIYASQVNANFAACALADLSNVTASIAIAQGGTGTTTAFTAGSLVFAGAAGAYSQNNADLFWDNTNYRLGIGTTVPATALDVRGNGSFGQTLATGTSVSTADTALLLGGNRTGTGNSYVSLFANGSSSASAQLYRIGGANGSLVLQNTGTGLLQIAQVNVGDLAFDTNSIERMRITSGGNVGIGTASPSYTLDVTGTIRATGTITGSISGNAATATTANGLNTGNSYSAVNFTGSSGGSPGSGAISFSLVGNGSYGGGVGLIDGSNCWGIYDAAGTLYFGGTTSGSSASLGIKATLDQSGNFTATGNVTAYSDIRLKTALSPIEDALDKIGQLTGYVYTRIDTGLRQTGLIAQDVQKVLPEAVQENEDALSIAYGNLMGLIVQGIKELRSEIASLRGAS